MPGPAGALHVAVRLPRRTAEPAGQLPRGVGCRHTRVQQVRGGIDPLGEHVTTSASATGRPTTGHVTNILLNMSRRPSDTPRQFDTPIAQRHLKAEVANCVGGVIWPLLANIYLHVLDTELTRRNVGELVRYADDGVVLCQTQAQAEHALAAVGEILTSLGLRLHPDKTKVVDLREGRDGLDFLGCHFRACMSGRLWEQQRVIRYCLHRWPSQTAMARLRAKVRDRTGRNRSGTDIRDVIADLNPVLRGWGTYFRTGNAATKFRQIDWYVMRRLRGLLIKTRGRNLRPGHLDQWTESWFNGHGLHRLRGTIRYPQAA